MIDENLTPTTESEDAREAAAGGHSAAREFEEFFGPNPKEREVWSYFTRIADRYELSRPIRNSVIRLGQEARIATDLNEGRPVLVRGFKRIGKSSMLESLAAHFGRENSLVFNAALQCQGLTEPGGFERFRAHFGLGKVARFIAEKEGGKKGWNEEATSEREYELEDGLISESGRSPFEYLNDWLGRRGETAFVGLDEVTTYAHPKYQEGLEYIARLRNLGNIRLALVVHRVAEYEKLFAQTFAGCQTHYIGAVDKGEVGRLVHHHLEDTPIVFTEGAVDEIYNFTGGRPMEVNILCRAILGGLDPNLAIYKFGYTAEDVRSVTRKPLGKIGRNGVFSSAVSNYELTFEGALGDEERELARRMVRTGGVAERKVGARAVAPLVDCGFLEKDNEEKYWLRGELLRRALSRYCLGEGD